MTETPELRCFGSNCDPVRVYDTQQAAANHEGTVHDGAQTVFAVVLRPERPCIPIIADDDDDGVWAASDRLMDEMGDDWP